MKRDNQPLRPGDPGFARVALGGDPQRLVDAIKAHDHERGIEHDDDPNKLAELSSDPTKLILILEASRPGVNLFLATLESRIFPPSTPLNDAFNLFIVGWSDFIWYVLFIPLQHDVLIAVDAIAAEVGLVRYDGIPICWDYGNNVCGIGSTRVGSPTHMSTAKLYPCNFFPVRSDNAFVIETAKGARGYTKEQEDTLIKAAWWEWEDKYGKHATQPPQKDL